MKIITIIICIFLSSCSSLNESIQLGSTIGGLGGAVSTVVGYESAGKKVSLKTIAAGLSIGAILGTVTSYFVHRDVERKKLKPIDDEIEIHFGDLPPNPFSVERIDRRGI